MIYLLSCEKTNNGGGIYAFDLMANGVLVQRAYFPCDRPMYAVKCKKGLCVLLRQPFENENNSGYFFVDEKLQSSSEIKSTKGVIACHLCVDNEDVYISNYISGNIVKNGNIIETRRGSSVHPTRQTEPHTHFINKTLDNYLVVCDLGTDTLAIYDKDLHLVSETKVPCGYGIRHLAFSKDNEYIYAINELIPSLSVFDYKNGVAKLIETINIDCDNAKGDGAAIRISDDGKFLYISLREENAICVFAVSGKELKLIQKIDCYGNSPRDINIVDKHLICTNQLSGNVVIYNISNGLLNKINEYSLKSVLCVL